MKQNRILDILLGADTYVSGQSLAEQLGVSRQAVWKEIKALRARGYTIESVTNRGYRLTGSPDYLNAAAVRAHLTAKIIGCELEVLESVGSTNDYLKILGANGCKSGAVAAAREQVSGKGRMGRTWQNKKDENVMFSVLLRPKMAPAEAGAVTPLAGLAVCKALRSLTGLDCPASASTLTRPPFRRRLRTRQPPCCSKRAGALTKTGCSPVCSTNWRRTFSAAIWS